MIEKQVDIATADGRMNTFVCHPERDWPHPLIIFYMDAPGIREELRSMARRLASTGYYVMLPNLYYRAGEEELGDFIGEGASAVRENMFTLMRSLTIPLVMADTEAFLVFGRADLAASDGSIGCLGYCMSGRYALGAAVSYPDRMAAAASIYGVGLLTDQADSPHLTAREAKAEIYVAWAEIDPYAPLELLEPFRAALARSGVAAEVELYEGVGHGFAFPQRPTYDRAAAERHWERLFSLFRRRLG